MKNADFFIHPKANWQRRYEAMRASFVERLSDAVVADRFGYKPDYIRLLKHMFRTGKFDFHEPVQDGKVARRRVSQEMRVKIRSWREQNLSAEEIAQLLSRENIKISVRTVERVLAEEGFEKLPRRTQLKIGLTVAGTTVPDKAQVVTLQSLDGQRFESDAAGIFLFAPFIAQLGLNEVVHEAGLPGTKVIPALNYLLSFLAIKLLGTERYAHVDGHSFDSGLGVFAGLNVLPKCTAMSTYSYSLDEVHIRQLQEAFVKRAAKLELYGEPVVNMDFHTMPHFGDESVLEKHWAGARNKVLKGALTLVAQDAESKLWLYTTPDIQRCEANDQVLQFLSFWRKVRRGVAPTFVFDSRFTTYKKLSQLNSDGVKFITLRRRGEKLLRDIDMSADWRKIHIPHVKRKFPNPIVHDSRVTLREYQGEVRQIIVRGNGREKPAFLITNDFTSDLESVVGQYARRWRIENGIAEAVKFFHLNSMSSPILTKVHFDVALTMVADTLYAMLASKLRGFEDCDAPKIYRDFVRGKGVVSVSGSNVNVSFPRRAHNPILRAVPWDNLPRSLIAHNGAALSMKFA
jgi:transposase